MKKRIFILFILLDIAALLQAQQLQHYTQYVFNEYVINPGNAGFDNYYQARINNRIQWVGITDAPRTFILSLYGPDRRKNVGYGGYVYNDVVGPTSRVGVYGSYTYILKIDGVTPNDRLGMGLSVGLLQYKIDGSKIILHDEGDPSLGNQVYTAYVPDANFGLMYKSADFYAGLSFFQLMNNTIKFKDLDNIGKNRVRTHFFFEGGYLYEINDDFMIAPSLMLKFMWPVPLQADITLRGFYQKKVWAGVSFRTMDALSFMVGYEYNKQIMFGYSYDLIVSHIAKYNSGTHEVMIGYKFSKIKNTGSSLKIDL
jgi:type IX secretion system PorP/SprF family membrane protein